MNLKVDYVADWGARLLSRFYEQYKGKPNLTRLARDVCGPQFQALEDAMQAFFTLSSIDDSEGVQLDALGRKVGQPRNGVADAIYRLYLKGRIAANLSTGGPKNIYRVFRAVFGATAELLIEYGLNAAFSMIVSTPITAEAAVVATDLLGDSAADGVRPILIWQQTEDAAAFTCALASFLSADAHTSDTTIDVLDGFDLPESGTFRIDPGFTAETVTVTTKSGNTLSLSAPLAADHDAGVVVEAVSTGLGFGDETDPDVGGALIGAAQA